MGTVENSWRNDDELQELAADLGCVAGQIFRQVRRWLAVEQAGEQLRRVGEFCWPEQGAESVSAGPGGARLVGVERPAVLEDPQQRDRVTPVLDGHADPRTHLEVWVRRDPHRSGGLVDPEAALVGQHRLRHTSGQDCLDARCVHVAALDAVPEQPAEWVVQADRPAQRHGQTVELPLHVQGRRRALFVTARHRSNVGEGFGEFSRSSEDAAHGFDVASSRVTD